MQRDRGRGDGPSPDGVLTLERWKPATLLGSAGADASVLPEPSWLLEGWYVALTVCTPEPPAFQLSVTGLRTDAPAGAASARAPETIAATMILGW